MVEIQLDFQMDERQKWSKEKDPYFCDAFYAPNDRSSDDA